MNAGGAGGAQGAVEGGEELTPHAAAAKQVKAGWVLVPRRLGPMFQRCEETDAVTGVDKCALCELMTLAVRLGGLGKVSGAAYNSALHELCDTAGIWGRPGDLRTAVLRWVAPGGGRTPERRDGYPVSVQDAAGAGQYFEVPVAVRLATATAMVVAERGRAARALAEVTETKGELRTAREVDAGSSCRLGKRPVLCHDGKMRECWTPELNDLLAGRGSHSSTF